MYKKTDRNDSNETDDYDMSFVDTSSKYERQTNKGKGDKRPDLPIYMKFIKTDRNDSNKTDDYDMSFVDTS